MIPLNYIVLWGAMIAVKEAVIIIYICATIQNMKILILGANSYVGARIYFELQNLHEVVGTYHLNKVSDKFLKLDITDKQAVLSLVNDVKPEIIIHCANNGSRKWCDEHKDEALILNQEATKYIVEGANNVNAKLVYISSSAVLDLASFYGKVKLESEEITKVTQAGYFIIRPGIVVGMSPKVKKEDGFFSSLVDTIDNDNQVEYSVSKKSRITYLAHITDVIKKILDNRIWNKTVFVVVPDLKTKHEVANDILTPLGILVKGDSSTPATLEDAKQEVLELKQLNLPVYSYEQIISKIIDEIKDRNKFVL